MSVGVVLNADPVDELPATLARAFKRSQAYYVRGNRYQNGESQRAVLTSTSRKVWELTEALTAAQLAALRTFYQDHNGPVIPFTYNDPHEDGITGQYTVRFDGAFVQTVGIGTLRGSVPLRLIELA